MRGFRLMITQLWRESAHLGARAVTPNDTASILCNVQCVDGPTSKRSSLHCQYRYPSPRRSGPFGPGPTPLSGIPLVDLRRVSGAVQKALELWAQTPDSALNKIEQSKKQNKGSKLCLKSVFFLPQRRSRLFRRVWTMTSNAVLQARLRGPLSQVQPAATPSLGLLWAALLARFATKSHVSAVKAQTPFRGAHHQFDRRSGHPLSGGFAYQGAAHV